MKMNAEYDIPEEVLDIRSMVALSIEEYRSHVNSGSLLWVDHHDILRVEHIGMPLATNKEQLDTLIEYLQTQRVKLADPA